MKKLIVIIILCILSSCVSATQHHKKEITCVNKGHYEYTDKGIWHRAVYKHIIVKGNDQYILVKDGYWERTRTWIDQD